MADATTPNIPVTGAGALPEALDHRYLLGFDSDELAQHRCDVLVLGSGIAGMTTALYVCGEREVALATKGTLTESNTWYAQGGIAGAVGAGDSVELHVADTLAVGQGLCDDDVVQAVIEEAPEALADLERLGMEFDMLAGGGVSLAREAGHSLPRVLHSGDTTGAAVQNALTAAVRDTPRISTFERFFLVDLLTEEDRCVGALMLDLERGALVVFFAGAVVLATGGAGQVYAVTTNPVIATGDGVAAAYRAGADISDMEFVQFHPTALDSAAVPRSLITEALRGEGAYLLDCEGHRFMVDAHPLAELAPRDVVSREIETVMVRCGERSVWLDARHLGDEFLRARFPSIRRACAEAGYELSEDLVPVAPAAHYTIGGVTVDLDGRASLPGLFATGEAAASGLHGANRLASNSLLEGVVFSRRIARILECKGGRENLRITGAGARTGGHACGAADREELEMTMSRHAGAVRTGDGLERAAHSLAMLSPCIESASPDRDALESANMISVSLLMTHAAWLREESRGTHWRSDFPKRDDATWRQHVVWRRGAGWRLAPRRTADERVGM